MFFMELGTACFLEQGQRGGCNKKKRGGVPASPHSLNSFVFWVCPYSFGFHNADTEKSGKTIATPPRKGGFLPAPIAALCNMPLSGPRGSLSSVFIPAGRLGKDAPERRGSSGEWPYGIAEELAEN